MKPNEFVIWEYRSVRHAAVFTDLRGFDAIHLFDAGRPLSGAFPADAAFHMNPDFPDDLLLPDNVGNSLQVNLVSSRVRKLLEQAGLAGVEYLPVSIIDHKGRKASSDHCIVHPLDLIDAIDLAATRYTPSEMVAGKLNDVTRLVVDASRVPADRQVFKLKGLGGPTLLRRELADHISAQRFTGFEWLELDDFES